MEVLLKNYFLRRRKGLKIKEYRDFGLQMRKNKHDFQTLGDLVARDKISHIDYRTADYIHSR